MQLKVHRKICIFSFLIGMQSLNLENYTNLLGERETILFDKPHSYFEPFDSFGSAGKHDWCLVWIWLVEKIVLVLLDQSQSKGKRNQNNPEFLWTQWKSLSFSRQFDVTLRTWTKLHYVYRFNFFLFWGLFFSLILDNERWKQADVPTELQSLVDSLVDGKIKLKFPLFRFIIFLNLVIFVFW